jgi:glycosyltransferase involved in cell wall biosynthesis
MEQMRALPRVSVVTPFYNRRSCLASCLEMLERQTLKDFEVIIVDDGSTDGLAGAIASARTRFALHYIKLPHNRGADIARNIGIDAAHGRYIALLDSDDAWHPDKLRRHLEQFEAAPDPDRLVGLSRQIVVGGRPYTRPKHLIDHDRVGRYLFQLGGVIQSSTMFMTSDLARAVRFAEGEAGHHDWTFALRLEAEGVRFEMLPDALTYYRDDDGANRLSPRSMLSRLDWLERHRELLGEGPYLAARAAFASHVRHDAAALGMITTGLLRGAVPPWRTAYYLAAWAFPSVRKIGVYAKQTWFGYGTRETRLYSRSQPGFVPLSSLTVVTDLAKIVGLRREAKKGNNNPPPKVATSRMKHVADGDFYG